jgi:hypothetical protein
MFYDVVHKGHSLEALQLFFLKKKAPHIPGAFFFVQRYH